MRPTSRCEASGLIFTIEYLNNILEQDHRFIKRITGPMMGFKAFHSAAATIAGIEVVHMIRKGSSLQTIFPHFSSLPHSQHNHVLNPTFSTQPDICDTTLDLVT